MAAASGEDIKDASHETDAATAQSTRKKPCRVCSNFKTWMKTRHSNEKVDNNGNLWANYISDSSEKKEGSDLRECPADREQLGRATWTFLHTTAAYYPDEATLSQQQEMKQFISALSKFYPCDDCADNLRTWLHTHPPKTNGRKDLSRWMCDMHNEVNQRLEKPIFDCSKVDERWLDGWKDGFCD